MQVCPSKNALILIQGIDFKNKSFSSCFTDFLVIFIIGIKYYGALHLWVDFQMHFYKYYAALPLNIWPRMCITPNYLQMNNYCEDLRCDSAA